jgi:hypothetical protein
VGRLANGLQPENCDGGAPMIWLMIFTAIFVSMFAIAITKRA